MKTMLLAAVLIVFFAFGFKLMKVLDRFLSSVRDSEDEPPHRWITLLK